MSKDDWIDLPHSQDDWQDVEDLKVSEIESGVRGFAQGATLGFADEATGAFDALIAQLDGSAKQDFSDEYVKNRDESREAYREAQEANPVSYGVGNVGGVIATTAFLPGLSGAASVAGRAGQAALGGAVSGLGLSESEDAQGMIRDTALGAGLGAGLSVVGDKLVAPAFKRAGQAVKSGYNQLVGSTDDVLAKTGKVLADIPEDSTQRYLANPKSVNEALDVEGLANLQQDLLDQMQGKSSDLSSESWGTLSTNSNLLKTPTVINAIEDQQKALFVGKSLVGKQQQRAFAELESLKKQIKELGNNIPETLQKRLIQTLDENINWNDPNAGITNNALANVRTFIDKNLKGGNEAFASKMSEVADVTKAIQTVKKAFENRQNPESYGKFLKSVKNLQNKGPVDDVTQALELIKRHTGRDLGEEILNSQARDAFAKGSTNGSRKAVIGGTIGTAVGSMAGFGPQTVIGGAIGTVVGGAADKYAGVVFKKLLDGKMAFSQEAIPALEKSLGKFAKPIINAAQRGNKSLAAAHYILSNNNPEYRQLTKKLQEGISDE
jgi:hypothetical protein